MSEKFDIRPDWLVAPMTFNLLKAPAIRVTFAVKDESLIEGDGQSKLVAKLYDALKAWHEECELNRQEER